MIINRYEESVLTNETLPLTWQSEKKLKELEEFLQYNWEQRSVFYDDGKIVSKQQFLGFTAHHGIRTKNYIGTIAFAGEQLNIFPKMFRTEAGDQNTSDLELHHLMKNLTKWLAYCNKVSYPFIKLSSDLNEAEDLRELFITLYLGYVRAAIERGLYYQYVEETENLNNIKGKFDIGDYVLRKIPNGLADKFQCTYSRFEFDNWINRVIKYTCKLILNSTSRKNQITIRNILIRLNEVSDMQCKPSDCDRVCLSKMQGNYRIIMSMSRMFLLNKTPGFSLDINESFCFLFPTELLFEGFIGGYIQEVISGYGGKVRLQQSDMHLINDIQYAGRSLGPAFLMRHDILVDYNNKLFILDTKYKQIARFEGDDESVASVVSTEPEQTDIYQVCGYARKRNCQDVYLLYPMYRYEEVEPDYPVAISLDESGANRINIHFIRLPFIFEQDEEKLKQQLKLVIMDIID